MHWGKDVLGKSIQTEEGRVKIVGVIKDFNIGGFYSELKPFVLHHHPKDLADLVYLRLKEPFGENLQKLKRDATELFLIKQSALKAWNKKWRIVIIPFVYFVMRLYWRQLPFCLLL